MKIRHMQGYILMGIIFIFTCCKQTYPGETGMDNTLSIAGKNRAELEKVLSHYSKHPEDSLKYQAACFLIENMQVHKSNSHEALYRYFQDVNATFRQYKHKDRYQPRYDSLTREVQEKLFDNPAVYDCQAIRAGYLIRNIDCAFDRWALPWAKHLSFNDFCEYLLPYKVNEDAVDRWRIRYAGRLIPVDSLLKNPDQSIRCISERISDSIVANYGDNAASYSLQIPYIYPSALIDMEKGTCSQQSQLSVYYFRALGIPACIDFVPQWGNRSSGHSWNVLKTPDGYPETLNFSKAGHLEKVVLSEKPTKIYRKTYARQKNNLFYQAAEAKEDVPAFFQDPCLLDVTKEYAGFLSLSDITITLKKLPVSRQFAYLAVFNNQEWIPVDWSRIRKNKVKFQSVGNNVVYILMIYAGNSLIPVSLPFILGKDSRINDLKADTNIRQPVNLYRKYPPFRAEAHAKRMLNGRFQAANRPDFKHAVDLYCLSQPPGLTYTTIKLTDNKYQYRYIRYIGADSMHCNIAEMEVYSGFPEKLPGKVIGTEGSFRNNEDRTRKAAFDGDPLTFFDAPDPSGGWTGLDLGKPYKIDRIRFLPRNDDNNIKVGDQYELLYWGKNGDWVSLGLKTAEDIVLKYDNAPANALYLLHNHSRGKEERIFTCENGKQLWW